MAKTIVGLFDDVSTAQQAVRDLQNNGFDRNDISLMAREQGRGTEYDAGTATGSAAGDGAAAGAGTGAVLGGLAGLLVGLTALAIPGIGPIIAAGPLVTTLAGAGAGAVAGGIIGALTGAGVPEEEAHAYAEGVRRGGTLVVVRSSDEMAGSAHDIISRYDPVDIRSRSEYWRQGKWQGFDEGAAPFTDQDLTRERDYWRSNTAAGSRTGETTGSGYGAQYGSSERSGSAFPETGHAGAGGARYDETTGMGTSGTDYSTRAPRSDETFDTGRTAAGSGSRYDETRGTGTGMSGSGGMRAGSSFDRGSTGAGYDAGTGSESGYDTGAAAGTGGARSYPGMRRNFNDYSADFRNDFNTTYRTGNREFGYYEPAYRYGYDLGGNERFRGRQWNDFEAEARNDWEKTHPNNPWEDVKDAVRHAWERVTGE